MQDFHQPLHGLIRRLKEFLQPLKDAKPTSTSANGAMLPTSRWQGENRNEFNLK
jgi:hypothetical protein